MLKRKGHDNWRALIAGFGAVAAVASFATLLSCGGSGGSASNSNPNGDSSALPAGCIEIGSFANSGGPVTIQATCGSSGVEQCFTSGAGSSDLVPVPCNNAGITTVVAPTPIPFS